MSDPRPATCTPVALIIFNRPDHVRAQIDFLRAHVRPERLFVIGDGPRADHADDVAAVDASRAAIEAVDWPCAVETDYAEENLGCALRVASGLTGAFLKSDRLIVLEDDVRPDPTFFPYCDALLDCYAQDERVMHIGGNYHMGNAVLSAHSYYFSRYMHCWGWASWRRAWACYDHEMTHWPALRDDGWLHYLFDAQEAAYWTRWFDDVHGGRVDTWDMRWQYALWRNSGLAVHPRINLVANAGIGDARSTHTKGEADDWVSLAGVGAMDFPMEAPPHVLRNFIADAIQARTRYQVYRRNVW